MDDAAQRRVDELLERIKRSSAYRSSQLLRATAAEERTGSRAVAEHLAAESGRSEIVRHGRAAVRRFLDRRFAEFNIGIYYGTSADPTTPRDRIEIDLALEDLVLATAVEDLLPADDFAALATDGANLLVDIPERSSFPSVYYAPAEPDEGSTQGTVRVMQITVVAALVAGSLLAIPLFGPIPALFGGCLVASIVASWIWRRDRRADAQESETP